MDFRSFIFQKTLSAIIRTDYLVVNLLLDVIGWRDYWNRFDRSIDLGRSDYLVVANVFRSGDRYIRAYLWELKAPQCFIYEEDTRTRLKPSQDFVDAENQLLNYYYGLKENAIFQQQYGICAASDISLGGIIIGCERTKVRGNYTREEKVSRYNIAKRVKDQLYDGKLKVRTWDEICSFIGAPRRENVIQ